MDNWISVKDRLPDHTNTVLIWNKPAGYYSIGYCEALTGYPERVWQDNETYYTNDEISHWQPLPEPPSSN